MTDKTLEEKLSTRTRNISVSTYATEEEIANTLNQHQKQIRAFAYIYHDKDKKPKSDDLKEPHYHVIVITYNSTTPSAVIKWFDKNSKQNTFAEPVETTVLAMYEYLTHKNPPDKFQYNPDDIVHGNLEYWVRLCDEFDDDENIGLRIIEDLIQGTNYYDMTVRYGREWVIYHERYEKMALKIRDGFRL